MADQNKKEPRNSSEAGNPINFPPQFLESLVLSFPIEWRGLFAALNSEQLAIEAATMWLEKKLSRSNERLSNIPPNWKDFIDNLIQDFPFALENKLFIKPKIILFPLNIQRNVLAFISRHSNLLTLELLEKLVTKLGDYSGDITGWRSTHLKFLASKLRNLKRTEVRRCHNAQDHEETHPFYTDILSEESRTKFTALCEKARGAEYASELPWFSQILIEETKGNKWEIGRKEDKNVPSLALEKRVVTTTDIGEFDAHAKTACENHFPDALQESHSGTTSGRDVEIIDIPESPVKRLKTEHSPAATAQLLTVPPPPPEHFIMETEDLKEHLIMETEDLNEQFIMETEVANSCRPQLSEGLQMKLSALENLLQSPDLSDHNFTNELEMFSSCSRQEVESICSLLKLKSISESTAVLLCQLFVVLPIEPSFSNAVVFASHCLLPKIQGLRQAVSRVLLTAITSFAKKHSRAFCDGVVINLIHHSNLDTPQADVINKVIKDCLNEDTKVYLLEQALAIKSDPAGLPFMWSENTVSVVQTAIDSKPELNTDIFHMLVVVLEQQSRTLTKSLKFGKMLLAVINKYCQQVSLHHNSFMLILEGNNTFLKKAGLSALKKISKI